MTKRYAIAVDLDGTLAEYNGWKGADHIGDPIPAMVEKVIKAHDEGKEVHIFTARMADCESDKEIDSVAHTIRDWLVKHGIPFVSITSMKHRFFQEFWDDRAKGVIPNTGCFSNENGIGASEDVESEEGSMALQVGGNHYNKLLIQPAEFALLNDLGAAEAMVIKYVTRHQDKAGKEDLEKAKHFINMIIEHKYENTFHKNLLERIAKYDTAKD